MNRDNVILTALVIFVISAVLLVANLSPSNSEGERASDTIPVISEINIQVANENALEDSLLILGNTGYTIRLPKEYRMTQTTDSSFSFFLIGDTCKCAQLKMEWKYRQGPVPGTLQIGTTSLLVLGNYEVFTDYPLIAVRCIARVGSIKTQSGFIYINCMAPAGKDMERLFKVVVSLAKSPK